MMDWAKAAEAREAVSSLRACLRALSPPDGRTHDDYASDQKAGASTCTVGLMLSGCTIDDTMPGSPSFLCAQIKGGDVVEAVDGVAVTLETLVEAIRGPDLPGSKIVIQLRSPDRTLKTVNILRQPRAQVLERRDLFLRLDEMRSLASTHVLEQRGKKKPDENLIRFLNKSIEDLTTAIRQISKFEGAALDKERDLRGFIDRVQAVTQQYLGRLDYALREDEETGVDGGLGESLPDGEANVADGKERNPSQTERQTMRFEELERRAIDAEAALQLQQQAHAAVLQRMQAEVQSLQDQLAFARAVGDEPSATNADDMTLSGQLSRAKTKMAKLEAELVVAKDSLQSKNAAIAVARQETLAAIDSGKADREALKSCRQALQQAQQDLKDLQRQASLQRLVAGGEGGARDGVGGVGGKALVASLEAQVAQLTKEVASARARATAADMAAAQAQEEARILLRKRQADQSALAQVEADVVALMMSPTDGGGKGCADAGDAGAWGPGEVSKGGDGSGEVGGCLRDDGGGGENPEVSEREGEREERGEGLRAEDKDKAKEETDKEAAEDRGALDAAANNQTEKVPLEAANKHKYEAAIVKIGSLQQTVAELQHVIQSYQKEGKTGLIEMQTAARSASEAKKQVEAERQRRGEERSQLTGAMEQMRATLEGKLAVAEKARSKLQEVLKRKEVQLDKVSEEAQKAAIRMKEELNSMQARHEAAWQRTAEAVDQLESETRKAQEEREEAVRAREEQVERMQFLEQEHQRLSDAAAVASADAERVVAETREQVCKDKEQHATECAERIAAIEEQTSAKVAALQEQLRSAHDSVADSYTMVSQAQAKCVEEVDKFRAAEALARKEARESGEALQAEVRKIQRHLAGVTGIKDSEIDRLNTRVQTLEMTLKTRNTEAVALQLEAERVNQQLEQERQRRQAAESDLEHARTRLLQADDKISSARMAAAEAEERIRQRERQLLDEMRAEMQEEGLLEVRLQEAREETARLAAENEELRSQVKQAPATKLEAEAASLRAHVASLEQDLLTARAQLSSVREAEASRSERMKTMMGEASGALAKDLEDLLSLKLGKAQLEASCKEALDEAARAAAALEAAKQMHEAHVAALHTAEASEREAAKQRETVLRNEAEEVRHELELKAQHLSEALDQAAQAERQLHALRTRVADLEDEVKKEQAKRKQELDILVADMAQAQREAEEREKELGSEVSYWKHTAEEGDYGTVHRLQEHLEQLRETAEEEVAGLSLKVQVLERERREQVSRLEAEVKALETDKSLLSSRSEQALQEAKTRAKEKDKALRLLQKQVATFEEALKEAATEVETLRETSSTLQREKGDKVREAIGLMAEAEAAQEEALLEIANDAGTPVLKDKADKRRGLGGGGEGGVGGRQGSSGGGGGVRVASWLPWRK